MQHSPDYVHPRDVEKFNPKDRAIIMLIDEALRDYDKMPVVRRPGEIGSVACHFSFDLDNVGSEQVERVEIS